MVLVDGKSHNFVAAGFRGKVLMYCKNQTFIQMISANFGDMILEYSLTDNGQTLVELSKGTAMGIPANHRLTYKRVR